jgi:hypothetical protein
VKIRFYFALVGVAIGFLVGDALHPFLPWRRGVSPAAVLEKYGGMVPMHAYDGTMAGRLDGKTGACFDPDGGDLDCKEFNLRIIYGRAERTQ